jgi:CYTH domain-containing protein
VASDIYKLTQKVRVRDEDPADVSITNMYLPPEEHALLAALPAGTISKTRSVQLVGGHVFVVDVFHRRLRGLRLAEVEVEDLARTAANPRVGRRRGHA